MDLGNEISTAVAVANEAEGSKVGDTPNVQVAW